MIFFWLRKKFLHLFWICRWSHAKVTLQLINSKLVRLHHAGPILYTFNFLFWFTFLTEKLVFNKKDKSQKILISDQRQPIDSSVTFVVKQIEYLVLRDQSSFRKNPCFVCCWCPIWDLENQKSNQAPKKSNERFPLIKKLNFDITILVLVMLNCYKVLVTQIWNRGTWDEGSGSLINCRSEIWTTRRQIKGKNSS